MKTAPKINKTGIVRRCANTIVDAVPLNAVVCHSV